MNKLSQSKRIQIINLLVEGNSIRGTSRITGCAKNTILTLFVAVGKACIKYHNENMYNIPSKRIECDEIWSFVYAKQKKAYKVEKRAGDAWTWIAIDPETKLIVSWLIGNRDIRCAKIFMEDVASRLKNRVQLTTDGFKPYLEAVEGAFGKAVDFSQVRKLYSRKSTEQKAGRERYIGAERIKVIGNSDRALINTTYVERQNLTMRTQIKRFTRKTNAFSKKLENHCYSVALHVIYYNFVRIHSTIRVTPAMEAGITKDLWSLEDILRLADNVE